MFSVNSTMIARPSPIGYAPVITVTALTGGGADALDGLDITDLEDGYILGVNVEGVDLLRFYKLRALADGEVEDGVAIILNDDDATRCWVSVL